MLVVTELCRLQDCTIARFYDTELRKWRSLKTDKYTLYDPEDMPDEVVEEFYKNKEGEINDYDNKSIIKPPTSDFENIDNFIRTEYNLDDLKDIMYNIFTDEKEVYKMIILPFNMFTMKSEIDNYIRLNHDNVMKLNNVLVDKDRVTGFTIAKGKPLLDFDKKDIKISWLIGILKGIYYFEVMDFTHRDIKADNIIILNDVAKIIDLAGEGYTPFWGHRENPDDIYSFRKMLIELYVESPPKQENGDKIEDENVKFIYDNAYDLSKVLNKFKS